MAIAPILGHISQIAANSSRILVRRASLFLESKNYYYVVEIAYSPQTSESPKVWAELNRMVESFRILK